MGGPAKTARLRRNVLIPRGGGFSPEVSQPLKRGCVVRPEISRDNFFQALSFKFSTRHHMCIYNVTGEDECHIIDVMNR